MNTQNEHELKGLLRNKADGEAQVAVRTKQIEKLKGEEAENYKLSLAREQANLAAVNSRIAELSKSKPTE